MNRYASERGLTSVEILSLVVVAILLVVVTFSLRSIARERGYADEMRLALRNVAGQQESYLYDHAAYAGGEDLLAALTPVQNVTVTLREATTTGWSATAAHALSPLQCSIFVGNAAPLAGATEEGVIVCA